MGPLVAAGGIGITSESVAGLECKLDALCLKFGFPPNQPFKWSPGRELWMRSGLVGPARSAFYQQALMLGAAHAAKAFVAIEDTHHTTATQVESHELDVVRLLLERLDRLARMRNTYGIVIADRPGGDRKDEEKFLAACLETLKTGTNYVRPERITKVVVAPSKYHRVLQLADLITGCTLSYVSGEHSMSPVIFPHVRPLLACEGSRIGGIGVKIHPDYLYANLYHWLFGDTYIVKVMTPHSLPLENRPYSRSANSYTGGIAGMTLTA